MGMNLIFAKYKYDQYIGILVANSQQDKCNQSKFIELIMTPYNGDI